MVWLAECCRHGRQLVGAEQASQNLAAMQEAHIAVLLYHITELAQEMEDLTWHAANSTQHNSAEEYQTQLAYASQHHDAAFKKLHTFVHELGITDIKPFVTVKSLPELQQSAEEGVKLLCAELEAVLVDSSQARLPTSSSEDAWLATSPPGCCYHGCLNLAGKRRCCPTVEHACACQIKTA